MERCNYYNSLPEDLLIEILSWLPVKSLLRFRCVCKSFYKLVENPNFASKHLLNSNNNITGDDDHHRRILVHQLIRSDGDRKDRFMSLSYETLDVIHQDLGFEHPDQVDVLGCFNGVVCLCVRPKAQFVIWNPATRQIKILPECTFIASSELCYRGYGFAYDFKTNDYKVIAIRTFFGKDVCPMVTKLYSLSTDSWRQIDGIIPDGFHDATLTACINGVYCMLLSRFNDQGEAECHLLLRYDVSDEVSTVKPITGLECEDFLFCAMISLNNSVAVVSLVSLGFNRWEKYFEIIVLNEYESICTWTKLYTIGRFHSFVCPLKLRRNDEFLVDNGNGELVLCDSASHKLKRFRIGGKCLRLLEYKESLVSLNGGNHR